MCLPEAFALRSTYVRGELDSCKMARAIAAGILTRGSASAISVPPGAGYWWCRVLCSTAGFWVLHFRDEKPVCGARSLARGSPRVLQPRSYLPAGFNHRTSLDVRGCSCTCLSRRRHTVLQEELSNTCSYCLMQKLLSNLPVWLLGSLFQRARMTTCRSMLPHLLHASPSFLSSFPKSKIKLVLRGLLGRNSIQVFCFTKHAKQFFLDKHAFCTQGKKNQSLTKQITAL